MSRKYRTKDDIEYQRKMDALDKVKITCSKCGKKAVIPVYVDKLICHWCGHYVYRNKKSEFKDRLNQRLKEGVNMMSTEEQIFKFYKDQIIKGREFKAEIMEKFNISQREASDIYARINNYQVKKYGKRLDNTIERVTKEESERVQTAARTRQNMKKKKYWESTLAYKRTDSV